MIRLLIGTVLAAVVVLATTAAFWMFTSYGRDVVQQLPNDRAEKLLEVLKADPAVPGGNYVIPYPYDVLEDPTKPEAREAYLKRLKDGPLVQLVYRPEGVDPLSVEGLLQNFAWVLAASLLAAILLAVAMPGLDGFLHRWVFVAVVGVFAAVAGQGQYVALFHHPWWGALLLAACNAVAWALAGFVLAIVIRPTKV
jgi:hypothetical protein